MAEAAPNVRCMSAAIPIAWPDADMLWFPQGAPGLLPDDSLQRLSDEVRWARQSITLFGRTHMQPRLICWMGDPGCDYRYSARNWQAQSWHPLVLRLRQGVEALCGASFNSVLINLYRDGQDSMGYHSDDEPELGERPVIASLSLGQERTMLFRHRHDSSQPTRRLSLVHGSLLLMRGDTQANWKHAIPKSRKVMGPRINLTFRRIIR